MYRVQRHFYDLTRKFYLLGRDRMIRDLSVPAGGSVLELGCGTGRNLVAVGERYRDARLHGIDISAEMLKSAAASARRAGLDGRLVLGQGDASAVALASAFPDLPATDQAGFDRVFISYALSMIPDWKRALGEGLRLTRPGGRLAVVDFGPCDGLPGFVRMGLYAWLDRFHVTPRQDLVSEAQTQGTAAGARMRHVSVMGGYATYLTLDRPA